MIPPFILPFISRIGIKGGVIIALALFAVAQTARIEGAMWIDGYKADLAACEADKAQLVQASADAHERAVQARMAAQERFQRTSEHAQIEQDEMQRQFDLALRQYANRLRAESGLRSGGSIAAPGDSDSAVLADVPPGSELAVSYADLQICTANTAKLIAAVDWAATLNEVAE